MRHPHYTNTYADAFAYEDAFAHATNTVEGYAAATLEHATPDPQPHTGGGPTYRDPATTGGDDDVRAAFLDAARVHEAARNTTPATAETAPPEHAHPTHGRGTPDGPDTTEETHPTTGATPLGIAYRGVTAETTDSLLVPAEAEIGGVSTPGEGSDFSALSGARPLHTPQNGRSPYSRRGKKQAAKKGRPKRWLSRSTSTARFREYVAATYPGLAIDPAYWLMMEHLLFASERKRGDNVHIPHDLLARFCDVNPHDGGFRSRDFLERFREDVLPGFAWTGYEANVKVRTVEEDGLHPSVLAALAIELETSPYDMPDRVYFASGHRYDAKRDAKELRNRDRDMIEIPETDDQRFIQAYLHGLHPRSFAFLGDNFHDAYGVALKLENDHARLQALQGLRKIVDQPFPFYNPTANSYRLFSITGGLQQLNRVVRTPLMRGTWDVDADALHLAIMAKAWDIPELQAFLETNGAKALWHSIVEHVAYVLHGLGATGSGLTDEQFRAYKAAIKHGVYALGYGGGKDTIAQQVRAHDGGLFTGVGDDDLVGALMSHEHLGRVFEAKNRMLALLTEQKYLEGAYGRVHMQKGRGPLSVLAMVCSSYELALMRTVFDVATEHEESCTILLYQFDGVSVKVRREKDTDWVLEKMKEAFDAKAKELSIATQLSADQL